MIHKNTNIDKFGKWIKKKWHYWLWRINIQLRQRRLHHIRNRLKLLLGGTFYFFLQRVHWINALLRSIMPLCAQVCIQIVFPVKPTAAEVAFVRLLASMNTNVRFKMAILVKGFRALLAVERFFSSMNPHVVFKVTPLVELFLACITGEMSDGSLFGELLVQIVIFAIGRLDVVVGFGKYFLF